MGETKQPGLSVVELWTQRYSHRDQFTVTQNSGSQMEEPCVCPQASRGASDPPSVYRRGGPAPAAGCLQQQLSAVEFAYTMAWFCLGVEIKAERLWWESDVGIGYRPEIWAGRAQVLSLQLLSRAPLHGFVLRLSSYTPGGGSGG